MPHSSVRWLSEKEAAALAGLSIHTLRSHRQHRRGIPYSKIGRAVRYAFDDVVAYMTERRVTFEGGAV
ncbi:helix-turn-helix domain-containing protein [uncultured Bilophila sp.]|uniref:helix-turn-helix domain-containing protein n=1 Tax=uncultured Bilophila sp. TaxID=529385 RepID=UPI0035A70965